MKQVITMLLTIKAITLVFIAAHAVRCRVRRRQRQRVEDILKRTERMTATRS